MMVDEAARHARLPADAVDGEGADAAARQAAGRGLDQHAAAHLGLLAAEARRRFFAPRFRLSVADPVSATDPQLVHGAPAVHVPAHAFFLNSTGLGWPSG